MSFSRLLAGTCMLAVPALFSGCDSAHPASASESVAITGPSFAKDKAKTSKDKTLKIKDVTLGKCKEDCTLNAVTIEVNYVVEGNETNGGDADIDAVTLICYAGSDGIINNESCTVSN